MRERTFIDSPAVREATPLLIGLIGPSGTGKTKSALRLAKGIQRVIKGEIYFIDTESRRALHYTSTVPFRHVPFGAPFSPADYHAAFDHCAKKGAGIIICDSMSHEHEGPGGVLEMHEEEVARLSGGDSGKAEKIKMLAWQKPKKMRVRFIQNAILQSSTRAFIFCFRAKEKIMMRTGKDPVQLGFMPIAGEEYVFEMTLKCLLLPGADGVPTWASDNVGEKMMMKLPEQFRVEPYRTMLNQQLSEDTGEQLARWAQGSDAPPVATFAELAAQLKACSDGATFRAIGLGVRASWPRLTKGERDELTKLNNEAKARISGPPGDESKRSIREPGEDD